MNFHAIASLVISVSIFSLCLFIYIMGNRKITNITLSLVLLLGTIWSFGQFMAEISSKNAFFWVRIHQAAAVILPVVFLQFIFAFLGKLGEKRHVLLLCYFYLLIFLPLSFSKFFIKNITSNLFSKAYPVPGFAFNIYAILYFIFVFYGFYELFLSLKLSRGNSRSQIIYVILASAVSMLGGSVVFLPIYGINIFPFTYYSIPIFAILTLYAMFRYRLLDIKIVLRRGLVYIFLTALFSFIYIIFVFSVKNLFKATAPFDSFFLSFLVVFAFTVFVPLRDRVQDSIDKIFFKNIYEYQKTLKILSQSVTSILNLSDLSWKTVDTVSQALKPKWVALLLREDNKFIVKSFSGANLLHSLDTDGDLVKFLSEGKAAINIDGLGAQAIKEEMRTKEISLLVPVVSKSNLKGILSLGEKITGQPFSEDEVDLLTILSNQLAIAIENAKLHEEILEKERELFRADKLASLGTIAAGMAHEIKNPLASIKGLTQILQDNISDNNFIEKFMSIVPRQIDRISSILERLLTFGKPGEIEKSFCSINDIIDDVLKLISAQCLKNSITIKKNFEELPKVMLDKDKISQAILNFFINSIEAMPKGGEIFVLTRQVDNGICIEIKDTGIGIPPENIKNIFDPFFTNKPSGTGMGLAVTYRIIEEHKGKIDVESEVGKGTTFKIFLPVT